MNWLKKIWKAFSEPLPPHISSKDVPEAKSKAKRFSPEPGEQAINNFTPRAQQVLALSRREAKRFNHNFVGTEHVLLGLVALGQGVAVNVLQRLGLDLQTVRGEVERQIGTGPDQKMIGNIPYTPRVKKVLALAAKEANVLHHTYVGTEHILLGLLREGDGVAARILQNLKADTGQVRVEILQELDPYFSPPESPTTPASEKQTVPVAAHDAPAKPNIRILKPIEGVDLTQRYDVYCSERFNEVVVYRNALFKGVRKLFHEDRDALADFYELEQADGQTVFVAKYSVVKFCPPGTSPNAEDVPEKLP
jgi:hypothetical protein